MTCPVCGLGHEWDEPVYAERDRRRMPAYYDSARFTFGEFVWDHGKWTGIGGFPSGSQELASVEQRRNA